MDLTEYKLEQLKTQLENAYSNWYEGDKHTFKPKEKTIADVISNNFEVIAITAIATIVLYKIGVKYERQPSIDDIYSARL